MPRKSLPHLVERQRRELHGEGSDRFADLHAKLVDEASGEELISVGGRWDRLKKEWTDEAPAAARVLRVHRGQLDGARFFARWLDDHLAGRIPPEPDRVYSFMLGGGQRSGKTYLGVACAILYATGRAGSIVWIVSPAERDHEEVQDYLHTMMPTAWYEELGAPWYRFTLPNGSKIVLRTGHEPAKLKKGDADFIVMNEAQQQAERAFAICRGRIAASGGIVCVVANPPDGDIGQWVGDFATEAEAGLRQARFFPLDPMDNPHIDHGPLLALAAELDAHTFDVEIRGLFLGAKNAVLHNWERARNERPPGRPLGHRDDAPPEKEITCEVLRWLEGRDYDRAVGVDMQYLPHMASVEMRFWENPLTVGLDEQTRVRYCHAWLTADVTLPAAEESDLCQAWLDLGWDPARTLIVADASGKWQFAERDPLKLQKLREQVRGRGSWDVFRQHGFIHIVNPDRELEKNPDVIERCRATSSRISTKAVGPYGRNFLFSDPRNKDLNKAIRLWPTKGGQPMRTSQYAHRCDCVTYLVQRFFPRRAVPGMPEVKVLKRSERRREMRAW